MSPLLPWTLFALGVGHLLYGAIKFRHPLLAVSAIGALALPKSPFLAALVIALLHVALGYGLV